jgi:hypothetical protein
MNRKFNIFLAATVLLSLLSCSREDIVQTPPDRSSEIRFDQVATKAGLSDLQDNGFGVWACVSSKDEANTVQYEPLLENELVYRKNGEWTYDNTENWISNSMFYFFAAYPYEAGFTQERIEIEENKFTAYTLDVVADGSADTEDILVANNTTDTTIEGYSTTVPLTFKHLFTKVNFKIRQNFEIDKDFNYYVTKVTLSGVKGNGTDNVIRYGNQILEGWNFENASNVSIVKEYSTPMILRNVGAEDPVVTLSVWNDGKMLIPQDVVNNGIKLRVDYFYDINLDDEDLGTPKFVDGFIPATQWEAGKSINYTLAIANSSFISFSQPTIEPWGAPQTGGTIIIK